jgi:hypothetical protein
MVSSNVNVVKAIPFHYGNSDKDMSFPQGQAVFFCAVNPGDLEFPKLGICKRCEKDTARFYIIGFFKRNNHSLFLL